jgi:hypothetical protein
MTNFRFDQNTHTYYLDDKKIPNVTEILSDLKIVDLAMIRKETLEQKAKLGTLIHKVCSKWDTQELDITSLNPLLLPYLEAWISFIDDYKIEWIAVEYQSYSSKWGFGFQLDRIGKVNKGKFSGKIIVADIKTGTYSDAVRYQLGGYEIGWNELGTQKVTVRICVQLINGKYKVYPFTGASDSRDFLILLQAWKIKHRR